MEATNPLWYKDAIIYEVHVRSFFDSAGSGVGDFRGLTQKLDYLADLGVTCVWLLPFYPSPLKDDGYDIADYGNVHPLYGKLDDFRELLREAHRRNVRVITELVINHTSDQHASFQRARHCPPGSPERDFYVWSDTAEKYKEARIIFKDFEPSNWTWDPVARAYYWHRFYSHQPDLNYDNPAVWKAILPLVDFWFDMGVDGMRLDAVPYLFEREGTNCENLPETHEFLRALRKHADERYPDRMFLAEANQWPEDAVAYFGKGDECQMAFHFPLMPRLFMALHQEDRFPILDILAQTPAIPDNCQWCLFLRNHDELTLEMVTDEERDYMYRAYAQDRNARINLGIRHRLAPLLRNDRRRIELMNALMFALPGTPVVYYGDEIGMGDNIYLGDRNGVRTPMQWSADRNAGFSRANPQKLFLPIIIKPEYHYEAINVEAQQNNPSSLLWWMKRLIAMRKRFQAFGRGTIEFLRASNPKVLVFVRRYREERVLMVANLSRFVQNTEIDLRDYRGLVPEELFGRSRFPPIGEQPYTLTLGPHSFYWFSLETAPPLLVGASREDLQAGEVPQATGNKGWLDLVFEPGQDELESLLPDYLYRRKVYNRDVRIAAARIQEVTPFDVAGSKIWLFFIRVEFPAAMPEMVAITLTVVADEQIDKLLAPVGAVGLVRVRGEQPGVVCDALSRPEHAFAIVRSIAAGRKYPAGMGELQCVPLQGLANLAAAAEGEGAPVLRQSERGNLSIQFGERVILKVFSQMEEGTSPTLEIGRFLTEREFAGAAPVVGYVESRRPGREPSTLSVLYRFVPNHGDAWQYTLDQLSSFFEQVAALSKEQPPLPPSQIALVCPSGAENQMDIGHDLVGSYLETARHLGQNAAELHLALASDPSNLAFAPEPISRLYLRSLYQSMRNLAGKLFSRLERVKGSFAEPVRALMERLLELHDAALKQFGTVLDSSITGYRIRCHGNYHLGQLLYTGKDFIVTDFERETSHTIGERRIKRSPLRDVASMVRSFDYAVMSVLFGLTNSKGRPPGVIRPEDRQAVQPWAVTWSNRVAQVYVGTYLKHIEPAGLLPTPEKQAGRLLDVFLLEQSLREIDHEISSRPDWVTIPLHAALRLLGCDPINPVIAL
jgi:maltose alpha-D-glucosyltransferase / alpha-amylase